MADTIHSNKPSAAWAWLFPTTFLLHITEEYWAGVALAPSPSKIRGANLSPGQFLIIIGIAMLLMIAGIILAQRFNFLQWLLVCLGTVMLVNGLYHFMGSVKIAGYNPGLISGVLVWIPLGVVTLIRLRPGLRGRSYAIAILVGVFIHGIVQLVARGGSKLFKA